MPGVVTRPGLSPEVVAVTVELDRHQGRRISEVEPGHQATIGVAQLELPDQRRPAAGIEERGQLDLLGTLVAPPATTILEQLSEDGAAGPTLGTDGIETPEQVGHRCSRPGARRRARLQTGFSAAAGSSGVRAERVTGVPSRPATSAGARPLVWSILTHQSRRSASCTNDLHQARFVSIEAPQRSRRWVGRRRRRTKSRAGGHRRCCHENGVPGQA